MVEAVQKRLDQNPQAMRTRRETVEHPFGTIKARMGATHFLMKTLPRVASEMALHVLAYNLTRVMNIMGVQPFWRQCGRSSPLHARLLSHRADQDGRTRIRGRFQMEKDQTRKNDCPPPHRPPRHPAKLIDGRFYTAKTQSRTLLRISGAIGAAKRYETIRSWSTIVIGMSM